MLVHSCLEMRRAGTVCGLQVGQLLMYVRISRSNRLLPFLTQIMALTQDCQCESSSPAVHQLSALSAMSKHNGCLRKPYHSCKSHAASCGHSKAVLSRAWISLSAGLVLVLLHICCLRCSAPEQS